MQSMHFDAAWACLPRMMQWPPGVAPGCTQAPVIEMLPRLLLFLLCCTQAAHPGHEEEPLV